MRSNEKTIQENNESSASTFDTSLFSELCANSSSMNVLLSPLSVYSISFGQGCCHNRKRKWIWTGASIGPTTFDGKIDPFWRAAGEEDDNTAVQLSMALSIWANRLKQSYIDGAISNHSADAFPLPSRYTPVDKWIEDKTNGMIKGFLGDEKIG